MKLKLSLAFIALYLLSLVITAPATLVTRFIPSNSGIKIGYTSGSVWSGQLAQVNYRQNFKLQKLTWDFDWLALFTLKIKADIKFDNGRDLLDGVASVSYGLSGLVVSGVNVDMKATEIMPYLTLPLPVTPSGRLNLQINEAIQGAPYCETLDGQLVWHDAKVEATLASVDLASPTIDLSCAKGELVALLTQKSDQLTTNAVVVLSKGESYALEGDIKARKKLDPNIAQAISWIGPKNSTGATVLKFTGRL